MKQQDTYLEKERNVEVYLLFEIWLLYCNISFNSQTEKEDMVRKSTNLLLTRTLSGCLATLIKRPGLRLLQLIQITINTLHLEHANVMLEHYVAKLTG